MTKTEINQAWHAMLANPPKSRLAAIGWGQQVVKLASEIPTDLLPVLTCPTIPQRFQCSVCGRDIGRSLWGWCSTECLEADVRRFKTGTDQE